MLSFVHDLLGEVLISFTRLYPHAVFCHPYAKPILAIHYSKQNDEGGPKTGIYTREMLKLGSLVVRQASRGSVSNKWIDYQIVTDLLN